MHPYCPDRPLRVLSLGAGVQSTVMLLMSLRGGFGEAPDVAIFADTGWEPHAVMEHLTWLESEAALIAPNFQIFRVAAGNIRTDLIEGCAGNGRRFSAIPYFTAGGGMGRRQCTREYKITPLGKATRWLLGYQPRQRIPSASAEMWIGITTDEATRMKPARNAWQRNRWPLIEIGMSRRDCIAWFADHYPDRKLVKSSCVGCPYHDDNYWRSLRDDYPDDWADAIYVDGLIRSRAGEQQYMHRTLVPLGDVDLRTAEDAGQINMFENECEGMCGV